MGCVVGVSDGVCVGVSNWACTVGVSDEVWWVCLMGCGGCV